MKFPYLSADCFDYFEAFLPVLERFGFQLYFLALFPWRTVKSL